MASETTIAFVREYAEVTTYGGSPVAKLVIAGRGFKSSGDWRGTEQAILEVAEQLERALDNASQPETDNTDLTPVQALYAAEWEMRKAVGVCADHDDDSTRKTAVRLLRKWSALRRQQRASEPDADQPA